MRTLFTVLLLTAPLMACQAPDGHESTPGETPAATESAAVVAQATGAATVPSPDAATSTPANASKADDDCGAEKVSARWLNSLPTDDVKADIAAKVGDRPIRYYKQGDPITLDLNPERLNVELGEDGRIKLFRCG